MHLRLVSGLQPLMLASQEPTQSSAKLLLGFGFTESDSQSLIPPSSISLNCGVCKTSRWWSSHDSACMSSRSGMLCLRVLLHRKLLAFHHMNLNLLFLAFIILQRQQAYHPLHKPSNLFEIFEILQTSYAINLPDGSHHSVSNIFH